MAFAQEESLHNKTLPFRYICSELIERLIYYWLGAVSDSSVPWTSQEPSVTLRQDVIFKVKPSASKTVQGALRFGPVVNDPSFSTNNQY
jgi:hypothetical protein